MNIRNVLKRVFAGFALLLLTAVQAVTAAPVDTILINGKVLTVDDRFTIVQAIAIRDGRIAAVGKTADVRKLADSGTNVIDLKGKTVIPGLIDNHAHFIRAAEHDEMRFDGLTSRRQAVKMLEQRVHASRPGEWIVTLGGWSEEQFNDDPRGFPLAELDRIAPDNPVVIQAVYRHSYLNTAALKAAKIDDGTPDPRGGKIEKDASGKLTGVIRGAGGVAFVAARIPHFNQDDWLANTRKLVATLNSMGLTAWLDAGGRGMDAKHYEPFKYLADHGELNIRVFWTTIRQPGTPQQVDKVLAEIPTLKPFQGSDYFENVGYGESVYGPATSRLLSREFDPKPENMKEVHRIAQALADRGLFLNAHAELTAAIDGFLDVFEDVNKVKPIKGLRWTFSHLDQVDETELDRMKRLDMYAEIHSRPLIQGALMHKVHGDRAWDMPPMRRVQDSGIRWGLGSDATAVTTSNPFYTLGFAVTGKMVGGKKVNRQTITREQALIAHTRSNSYFLFQESNLGSIQEGKYADLLVLNSDYLKVPADKIKDIKPLMTMVGGKIVYEAKRNSRGK